MRMSADDYMVLFKHSQKMRSVLHKFVRVVHFSTRKEFQAPPEIVKRLGVIADKVRRLPGVKVKVSMDDISKMAQN